MRDYKIAFASLKNGIHNFVFHVKQDFFDLFEIEQEFDMASIQINVLLDKHSTFLEFEIKAKGTVQLICDISNEKFTHLISNKIKVLVKFGEEYDNSNEEIIIIPWSRNDFNITQLIYETVVLAIPMKKLSPNLTESNLLVLEEFKQKKNKGEKNGKNQIDPRWLALKKLKK